jgi:methyltransferase-like protein 6
MRDYAVGDMAQKRFEAEAQDKEPNKLSDNFYVRGDGTRACFFTKGMQIVNNRLLMVFL